MHRIGRNTLKKIQTHHQAVHKSKRNFASQPTSGSKTLILVTGALLGGAGGTVAFCKYDPKFRASLESNAPAVKPLLLTILGPRVESVEPAPTRKIKSTKTKQTDPLERPLLKSRKSDEGNSNRELEGNSQSVVEGNSQLIAEHPQTLSVPGPEIPSIVQETPSGSDIAVSSDHTSEVALKVAVESDEPPPLVVESPTAQEPALVVESPNVEEPQVAETTIVQQPTLVAELSSQEHNLVETGKDDEFDAAANLAILNEMLTSCSIACGAAIVSNNSAESAITRHSALLLAAIDSRGNPGEGGWGLVREAAAEMEQLKDRASTDFDAAVEELEKLRMMLEEMNDPDVGRSFDGMRGDVRAARDKVLKRSKDIEILSKYQQLVGEAREMLEGELPLSGIVVAEPPPQPSEDKIRSKIKEEVMSESNRQLQLKLDQSAVEFNNKLKEKEREYEQEMRSKLRRQASAHAEQLAEALAYMEGQAAHKYQRIFDTKLSEQEHNHLLQMEEQRASHEEQTSRLSEEFQSSLNVAHSIVAGIQSALHGRAETENESRKAQELSLACDGLLFSLKYGDSGSPTPLSKDVECVRKVYRDNDAIEIISSSIPHEAIERGVYTEEVLRSAFSRISKICRRVSMVDQNRNSLFIYFLSYLKSLLTISTAQLAPPSDIDAGKLTPYTIIAYANHCVQRGDLEQAARFVNQLTGESRKVAEGWLNEVRLFLETRQAVEALSVLSNSIVIGSQLQ